MFSAGKNWIFNTGNSVHTTEFLALGKAMIIYINFFNVLPKQTTFEMKVRQVAIQVYIQQGFHDVEGFMF